MSASPGVMVVTGASRGIGAAVARLAASRGFAVCVNYRSRADLAQGVCDAIIAAGGRACAIQADVSVDAEVVRLFQQVDQWQAGPLLALVNNAGLTHGTRGLFMDMDAEQVAKIVAVNLMGTLSCSREAMRRMALSRGGKGGSIVHVSSQAGVFGGQKIAVYAASKAAINTFTVGLAREAAPEGIRVNSVSPGIIASGEHIGQTAEQQAQLASSIPLQRIGSPDDVAQAVMWLISESASYITGTILPVAGGR
ncbi:MAG: SDR family oxidoreductase [Magnetococcales bacterium]|nr:SDR family oxidoreductase [Magnetococcales bacterium]